ncbi:deiodinase-like protein [Aquimarina celericrescens]|uniref:Deiodinase-like protein n=1 Tax=Aquimarina celericrescens TaxID=1964542 RepID=A0ABW5AUY6_9FLAO|nr:redoxin domain-containing protein [Aquimarina celericrescens]
MKTIEVTKSDYNYSNFKAKFYQFKDFTGLKEGDTYQDFEFLSIQGQKKRLSDFLDKPLVVEMGSITCPMYAGHVTPMQELARKYPEFNFVVLYVREAHPGNNISCHKDFDEKVSAAKEAARFYDDKRTILVDDIDGEAHEIYGKLPNSVYVIDTDGAILFVKPWNNTDYLGDILTNLLHKKPTEDLKFRPAKPGLGQSFTTLLKGGWVSLYDFVVQLPELLWKHWKAGNLY